MWRYFQTEHDIFLIHRTIQEQPMLLLNTKTILLTVIYWKNWDSKIALAQQAIIHSPEIIFSLSQRWRVTPPPPMPCHNQKHQLKIWALHTTLCCAKKPDTEAKSVNLVLLLVSLVKLHIYWTTWLHKPKLDTSKQLNYVKLD